MTVIFIIIIVIILFALPKVRIYLFNLSKSLKYTLIDLYLYIKRKNWRIAPYGFINAYVGLFGHGKTLSAVDYVVSYYERYNNKLIYDTFQKCFVTQYVQIVSNVNLKIPYIPLESIKQLIDISSESKLMNSGDNKVRVVTLVLGDEFSVQLNSRRFATNIDPMTLNAILTCRHSYMSIIYTAQKFKHVDALLRQVTQDVILCSKSWRLQAQSVFDADDVENAGNTITVKPLRRTGFFVTDDKYNAYDSIAVVDNLAEDYISGMLQTPDEILQRIEGPEKTEIVETHLKKKYRKRKR